MPDWAQNQGEKHLRKNENILTVFLISVVSLSRWKTAFFLWDSRSCRAPRAGSRCLWWGSSRRLSSGKPLFLVFCCLLVLVASGCADGNDSEDFSPVSIEDSGGKFHLLGVQWTKDHLPLFDDRIRSLAGGVTVREIVWCDVEPVRGERDFGAVEEEVALAQSYGYRVLFRVRVGQCWATDASVHAFEEGAGQTGENFPAISGQGTVSASELSLVQGQDEEDGEGDADADSSGKDSVEKLGKTPEEDTQEQEKASKDTLVASRMPVDLDAYRSFVIDVANRFGSPENFWYAIERNIDDLAFWDGTFLQYAQLAEVAAGALREISEEKNIPFVVIDGGFDPALYGYVLVSRLLPENFFDYLKEETVPSDTISDDNRVGTTGDVPVTSVAPAEGPFPGEDAGEDAGEVPEEDVFANEAELEAAREFYNLFFSRRFAVQGGDFSPAEDNQIFVERMRSHRVTRSIDFFDSLAALSLEEDTKLDGHQFHYVDNYAYLEQVLDLVQNEFSPSWRLSAWEIGLFWPGEEFSEGAAAMDLGKTLAILLAHRIDPVVYDLFVAGEPLDEDELAGADPVFVEGKRALYLPFDIQRSMSLVFQQFVRITSSAKRLRVDMDVRPIVGTDFVGVAIWNGSQTSFVLWSDADFSAVLTGPPMKDVRITTLLGEKQEWGVPGLVLSVNPDLLEVSEQLIPAMRELFRSEGVMVKNGN